MLNRKSSAEAASRHLIELVPIEGPPVLEEHFFADGTWHITLSYRPPHVNGNNGHHPTRELKSFSIDGRTGEVISMKIRAVAG